MPMTPRQYWWYKGQQYPNHLDIYRQMNMPITNDIPYGAVYVDEDTGYHSGLASSWDNTDWVKRPDLAPGTVATTTSPFGPNNKWTVPGAIEEAAHTGPKLGLNGAAPTNTTTQPTSPSSPGTTSTGGNYATPDVGTQDLMTQQTFGDLLDPDKSVRNVLREQGISPLSGDPRVRSLIRNATAIMAPAYSRIAQNPDTALDDTAGLVRNQVQAALGGGGVVYSPQRGMEALQGITSAARRGQEGLTKGGPDAFNPGLQFLSQLMSDDSLALGMLGATTLGGLAPSIRSTISGGYRHLPELSEYLAARNPQHKPDQSVVSFIDYIMGYR